MKRENRSGTTRVLSDQSLGAEIKELRNRTRGALGERPGLEMLFEDDGGDISATVCLQGPGA